VRIVDSPDRADAVIYAGVDPVNAAGVARSATAPLVLGDALVLAGVADLLDPAARRRTVLVSSAPAPDSPAVRELAPAFEAAFGRPPGPYSVIGYRAVRAVIAAIGRVGPRDSRRQSVTAQFRPPPSLGFTTYRADGRPLAR
jgi:ABC-type branched-subunit amino acid transport system substrate-binding protein